MNIEDVKLFCKSCNKEIPLTVFQKTGLMGIHNQYESIPEICVSCRKEEDKLTGESEGERRVGMDDEITGTPI